MAAEQEDAARPRTNSNIRVYREQLPLRENYGLNEQLRNNKQEKATQHKRLGNLLRGYPPGAAEISRMEEKVSAICLRPPPHTWQRGAISGVLTYLHEDHSTFPATLPSAFVSKHGEQAEQQDVPIHTWTPSRELLQPNKPVSPAPEALARLLPAPRSYPAHKA